MTFHSLSRTERSQTPIKQVIERIVKVKLNTMKLLQDALFKSGVNVVLHGVLKGGIVSQVYAAEKQGRSVVVKHVEDFSPTYPTNLFISKDMLNVDTAVLNLLSESAINVPKVLDVIPAITTIVMEDLAADGYSLLSTSILRNLLPMRSAQNLGVSLADLAKESRTWEKFYTVESAQSSMVQRGLELRLAYPNNAAQYLILEREHTSHTQHWVWADGYPKNIFVDECGQVAFVDFAESYWGDQRIMLPVFVAHIATYTLAGYLDKEAARRYITECIETYREMEGIDETIFRMYFAMELLHRSNGRWIDGIETAAQKTRLFQYGLYAFEEEKSIAQLIRALT